MFHRHKEINAQYIVHSMPLKEHIDATTRGTICVATPKFAGCMPMPISIDQQMGGF